MLQRIGRAYYRFMTLDWLIERGVPQDLIIALLALGASVYCAVLAFRALVLRLPAQGRAGVWLTGWELTLNGIMGVLFGAALLALSGFFLSRWREQRKP